MKSSDGHTYLKEEVLLEWLGKVVTKHTPSLLRTKVTATKSDAELRQTLYSRVQSLTRVIYHVNSSY